MTLLNAPEYNARREKMLHSLLIGAGVLFALLVVLTVAGFFAGHGWLFSNLGAEHRVNNFFKALESNDYSKAYGIYYNDANWEQHPKQYSGYTLKRFTEDWTSESPVKAPITSHHIDVSATDGSGPFGTGIIVATRVNGRHKVFMYVNRADGTMTWPAPHVILYGEDR